MGLFTQEIKIDFFDDTYVIERQPIILKKNKVDLYVKKGLNAVINGTRYKGRSSLYELDADLLGSRTKDRIDAYVYEDKNDELFNIKFFGGQHKCSLSMLPKAKFDFSITGTADVMISDYTLLVKKFNDSITYDDIMSYLDKFRGLFGREIETVASNYITNDTTEVDLKASLNKIARESFKAGASLRNTLSNDGLDILLPTVSLKVNALSETDEQINQIVAMNNAFAIDGLIDEHNQKYIDRENAQIAKDREHEINVIRANNTAIKETKTDVNNNGKGPVVINNNKVSTKYCINCGEKLPASAVFCPKCGKKQ